MSRSPHPHRGIITAATVLVGAATTAVGVAGAASTDATAAQQHDIVLTNAADDAHTALIDAQVAQNSSLFDQQIALQQSIYYWAQTPVSNGGLGLGDDVNKWLFVDPDANPLSTNLFNGAFTRFSEAMVVSQAVGQVEWDHLLGLNQTLGAGGYESAIAAGLTADISQSGITPGSALDDALDALSVPATQTSFDGFHDALVDLQSALWSTGFNDLLGMFSL